MGLLPCKRYFHHLPTEEVLGEDLVLSFEPGEQVGTSSFLALTEGQVDSLTDRSIGQSWQAAQVPAVVIIGNNE